ncbi:MAG: acyltransferase [Flavobacteriales bacterium]|nr:acyltransferase [Flavobacteriales bacterium]
MKYIKGFDTIRALSISMVILAHSLPNFWLQESRMWRLISGDTGVLIFYVISGFLITTLLLKEKIATGKINLKLFFIRRFLRLLPPLFIFYLLIVTLMLGGYLHPNYIALLFSVSYLYNFVPNKYYTPELGHTWSLALEEQFYLTWPLMIKFGKSIKSLFFMCLIGLIACLIFLLFFESIDFLKHFKALRFFIPAIAPILIGVLLAMAEHQGILKKFNLLIWILIFAMFFISPLFMPLEYMKFTPLLQAIGIGALLKGIISWQDSPIVTILNNPLTSYIGKISYGIYVYQGLFLRTGPGGELSIQQSPQNLLLTILLAVISFELYEKKFLTYKKKYSAIK